jgi:hypothetical protein
MENALMPLNKKQIAKIDEMIGDNAKRLAIINELVGKLGADAAEVEAYIKENKTLQGMLKTITHRTKDVISAGTEAERKHAAKEIETLAKKAIKVLQGKASQ